jgi:hypothetical protein
MPDAGPPLRVIRTEEALRRAPMTGFIGSIECGGTTTRERDLRERSDEQIGCFPGAEYDEATHEPERSASVEDIRDQQA